MIAEEDEFDQQPRNPDPSNLNQFTNGLGDYTADLTLDQIAAAIR